MLHDDKNEKLSKFVDAAGKGDVQIVFDFLVRGKIKKEEIDQFPMLTFVGDDEVECAVQSEKNALLAAAENDHLVAVLFLLKNIGADFNYILNLFVDAAEKGLEKTVSFLLRYSLIKREHIDKIPYWSRTNDDGKTVYYVQTQNALMAAANNGHLNVVRILLMVKANINFQDEVHGYTALMLAVRSDKGDVVSCLLDSRADVTKTSDLGETALTLAGYYGSEEIKGKFMRRGYNLPKYSPNLHFLSVSYYTDLTKVNTFFSEVAKPTLDTEEVQSDKSTPSMKK